MGNRSDLRITKTLRSINSAFMELILKKPVHKITVTELAQRAEISKALFISTIQIFLLYIISWWKTQSKK